jgi:hypothetical protein
MKNLRRWELDSSKPLSLQLAADARLSSTDYTDDQVWELRPGAIDAPALALQTQYGGRAGLVSLVPMWQHGGRTIYQTQVYAKPPLITAFAPNYLQIEAHITLNLALQAEYWAMESHAVGGRFVIENSGQQMERLRLDLFGHVVAKNQEQKLAIMSLRDGTNALAMGEIGNLRPVALVQNGNASTLDDTITSPKIGVDLEIPAQGKVTVRWVHAGLTDVRDSLALAQHWLQQGWEPYFRQIDAAALRTPIVQTGKPDWDAVIASSYQQLVQAFLKPTASLPHGSFVATRKPWQGFSWRGDGSDHNRSWSGQSPTLAYLLAPGMASIDPQMAQGLVRNYLALQTADGWVDYQPGLAGQRSGMMAMPILARLAWTVFEYTEDQAFLEEIFPALLKFFERWFADDLDADGDGLPEWQSERQTGYVFMPTFATNARWAQNADIRYVETPDMAAYLLSEAISLAKMADLLEKKRISGQLQKRIESLRGVLESMWFEGRYAYRDRDSHVRTTGLVILEEGRGDEEHLPALPLDPPNRVILHIIGGTGDAPRCSLYLEGLDSSGKKIKETADAKAFVWGRGHGVYTSQYVYAQLDRVRCDGLSRVFRIRVETVDTTRLDIDAVLPLWSGGIPENRAKALAEMVTDQKHFWRANGVTMCSAQDAAFDPSNADGSGGVWPFWLTLVGEGLLDNDYTKQALELVNNLVKTQMTVLDSQGHFSEFYHSDQPEGAGERGHLAGIVPLHLLARLIGVRIINSGMVWVDGTFGWGKTIKITQHGVMVKRTSGGTAIKFPSGHVVKLEAGHDTQRVVDPDPAVLPPIEAISSEASSQPAAPRSPKSVIIEVQYDDDDQT